MRIHMNIEEKQTVKSRAEKVEEDIFDELFDSPESWLDIFIYICVYIYEYPKKKLKTVPIYSYVQTWIFKKKTVES